ncbi:MAG TPA: hypothetical protein VJV75_03775 [Candidatus Polarisedimenticolia bacterium]|nr:hypothetical protein [Candidatus Polarisedimenticolia bacterium]
MRRWLLILVVVALVGWLVLKTEALPNLVDVVARGKRLSDDGSDVRGEVTVDDVELLSQAGEVLGRDVDWDAYAAARMLRSEDGSLGQIGKVYKVHVLLNQARALGRTLASTVQLHTDGDRFGSQINGRFASGEDPYENDLKAAEYAIDQRGRGEDPTYGATNFVDKDAFGSQKGTGSFAALVARWAGDGKVPGTLPGAPSTLVFFWRGGVPVDVGATEVVV